MSGPINGWGRWEMRRGRADRVGGEDFDEEREAEEGFTDFPETVIERVTAKAVLLSCVTWKEQHWVPKSLLGPKTAIDTPGEIGLVSIATWFCTKEGIE